MPSCILNWSQLGCLVFKFVNKPYVHTHICNEWWKKRENLDIVILFKKTGVI